MTDDEKMSELSVMYAELHARQELGRNLTDDERRRAAGGWHPISEARPDPRPETQ